MSNPITRRLHPIAVLGVALAVVGASAACTSSTEVTDPTTTIEATGTSETTGGTAGTTRAPGTTADERPPGTTPTGDPDDPQDEEPTGDETADDYSAALIASFEAEAASGGDVFSIDVVRCVSPLWVDAIGVETFQNDGIAPADIESGQSGLTDVTISQAAAEGIVDAIPGCGLSLFDLFVDGLGSRVDDPAVLACVEGAVTEAQIRAALIAEIQGDEADDPEDLVGQCLN